MAQLANVLLEVNDAPVLIGLIDQDFTEFLELFLEFGNLADGCGDGCLELCIIANAPDHDPGGDNERSSNGQEIAELESPFKRYSHRVSAS
ncbi:hypothetical protein IVB43_23930 [Bradyrhizobium sp. 48]|uniref:hypothetical protein n=1 Tax=Bradyrhizobium sp. 48 TaxID=2782676 RepID=UPI001FF96C40|nr:hypothetical protein [Bradyrhizobium sp. 48]MCK1445439.1 hypothetical protein [Bradyrhizobium sp. 48]